MLDSEEMRWVRSTANELNNLLQVIAESSQLLENFCKGNAEAAKYNEMLHNAVERAAQVTRLMVQRTASSTPEMPAPAPANFRPSSQNTAVHAAGNVTILNPEGTKELIMLVDDEDFVTMLAARVLSDDGYRIVIANNGPMSLNIYKQLRDKIDLVILDFTMPMMDGSEVFNELRMINPRVAVMLSSGFTENEKLKYMLSRGLRGFIPKPYTHQKLLLQVHSTLDSIRRERAN
jgi:CheY-like chemotaxis protein